MIILLHGSGQNAKEVEVSKVKRGFSKEETFVVDLQKRDVSELKDVVFSIPLFSFKYLVIAQNIHSNQDLSDILTAALDDRITLLLVFTSKLTTSQLNHYQHGKNVKVYEFLAEKETTAFPYLDKLIEGDPQVYHELQRLQSEYGAMYIITMIYYLLRRNFLSTSKNTFMQNKIYKQKSRFNCQDWIQLYQITLETEYKIKMGLLDEKLALELLTDSFFRRCRSA